MLARSSRRYHNALAIERGPLVYSLKITEQWTKYNEDLPHREAPHCDYELKPRSAWQYALQIHETNLADSLNFNEHELGRYPFSPQDAPVSGTVKGRLINWGMVHGWAGTTPLSPVWGGHVVGKELETLTLIPYGCTNLRITEFPTL